MKLRIGTRRSPLARVQAAHVASLLGAEDCEIVALETTGDVIVDRPLREVGGKALFVKELDQALLDDRVDCAVHSLKDVPTELPARIVIAAVPERADPRDVLLSAQGWGLDDLPEGARIGTSSLRRSAQLANRRPDLLCRLLRGNVQTRLGRLADGDFDATLLAAAGLARLGADTAPVRGVELSTEAMVPAPGQGCLAITVRADDRSKRERISRLTHRDSALAAAAERGLAAVLGGSCYLPLGAYAHAEAGRLHLRAVVCSPDGTRAVRDKIDAEAIDVEAASRLGAALGRRMLNAGADAIVAELPQ